MTSSPDDCRIQRSETFEDAAMLPAVLKFDAPGKLVKSFGAGMFVSKVKKYLGAR